MANDIVAVTGGAGFVGQHLVKRLRDLGAEVRIIDLMTGSDTDLPGAEHVRGGPAPLPGSGLGTC